MIETILIGMFDDHSTCEWVMQSLKHANFSPARCVLLEARSEPKAAQKPTRQRFLDVGRDIGMFLGGYVGLSLFSTAQDLGDWFGFLLGLSGIAGMGIGYLAGAQSGFLLYGSTLKQNSNRTRIFVRVPIVGIEGISRAECIMKEFGAIDTFVQQSTAATSI